MIAKLELLLTLRFLLHLKDETKLATPSGRIPFCGMVISSKLPRI